LIKHVLWLFKIRYLIYDFRVCWPIQPVGALRVPRNRLVNAERTAARACTRIIVVAVSRFRPPTAGAPVQYKCDNWPWSILFCAKRTTVRHMRHVTCVYLCRRSNNRLPEKCYPPNTTSNYCRRRTLSTEQNRYLNNNFYACGAHSLSVVICPYP